MPDLIMTTARHLGIPGADEEPDLNLCVQDEEATCDHPDCREVSLDVRCYYLEQTVRALGLHDGE